MRDHSGRLLIQCGIRKEFKSMMERKWKSILACPSFKGKYLSTAISKLIMKLMRHYEQNERKVNLNTINSKYSECIWKQRSEKVFGHKLA